MLLGESAARHGAIMGYLWSEFGELTWHELLLAEQKIRKGGLFIMSDDINPYDEDPYEIEITDEALGLIPDLISNCEGNCETDVLDTTYMDGWLSFQHSAFDAKVHSRPESVAAEARKELGQFSEICSTSR